MFYFWVSGISVFGVFLFLTYSKLSEIRAAVSNSSNVDFALQAQVNSTIFEIIVYALVMVVVFSVVTFFYSVIITHRVAGPMVAIKAFIDELVLGNYNYNRNLRKYDELQPLMESVKNLAAQLRSKQEKEGKPS
jgi:signal transduction histidine kinase